MRPKAISRGPLAARRSAVPAGSPCEWANRRMNGRRSEVISVKKSTEQEVVGIPSPALLKVERERGYGSVPGLEDEELADAEELERQAFLEDWWPILAIPWRGYERRIRPVVDEGGHIDWGAYGTVDFARICPEFNKARYKLNKLKEDLRNALIMMEMVRDRLPVKARLEVVEGIRLGKELDDFPDDGRWAFAKWYLRARRFLREVRDLRRRAFGPPQRWSR